MASVEEMYGAAQLEDPNVITEVVSSKEETAAFNMETQSEQLPLDKIVTIPHSVASGEDMNDLYKDFVSHQADE